jgi:hypothetical protein
MKQSSNILLEIMALVSSADIVGIDEDFWTSVYEGGHLHRSGKAKALILTPGEFHVSLFRSLNRYFG